MHKKKNELMEIIKFRTNLKSEEDLGKVTPAFEQIEGISDWRLEIKCEDNSLSISGKNLDPRQIESILKQAGFQAEQSRVAGISGEDL